MKIKSDTRWVMVNTRTNAVWMHYTGFSKKEVIEDFMSDEDGFTGYSWKEFSKKYNWDCIKVKIHFEQINKK